MENDIVYIVRDLRYIYLFITLRQEINTNEAKAMRMPRQVQSVL